MNTMRGDATGELIKQGRSGTAYYVSATDYLGGTNENQKHLVTSDFVYPQAETSRTAASRMQTQYSYTFWAGRTRSRPARPRCRASRAAKTAPAPRSPRRSTMTAWAACGGRRMARAMSTYYSYHPSNGQLAYTLQDADPTSLPTSADSNSTKWVTSSDGSASSNKPTRGGGLPTAVEQVTRHEFDSQGRLELTAREDGTNGTLLSRHYLVYETNRHLRFPVLGHVHEQTAAADRGARVRR